MESKNEPELRFPEFTGHWKQYKLGEITDNYSGGTPKVGIKSYYGGNIPFIRSAEINNESTELFLTEEGLNNSSAKLVSKGDILYALYGATSGETGIAKINGAINQAILAIRPHKLYDAWFIMQWLRREKHSIISTFLQGGQGNLSSEIVNNLLLKIPAYNEQKKIGDLFHKFDNLLNFYQRKLDLLQKFKQGMLQQMFPREGEQVPRIRFPGFTDKWEICKLKAVANIFDGVHQTPDYTDKGVMFLSVENIATLKSDKYISEDAFAKDYKVYPQKGDILMTRIGDVGTPHVVETTDKLAFYVSLALLKPIKIDSYFLCNLIQAPYFQKGLRERTLITAIPKKINKDQIGEVQLYVPNSFTEQEKVGAFFQNLDRIINLHQYKWDLLKQLKKGLLQKLFV